MYPKTRGPRAIPEDTASRYSMLVEIKYSDDGKQQS